MSAAELSRRIGVNEGTISNYKKGAYEPKQRRLDNISKALDVSIPWLMGGDVPMNRVLIDIPGILPLPKTVKRPRLGTISCGQPIMSEENFVGYDDVPEGAKCDFTLKCDGDSMTGARINDGDIVYIRQTPIVENGSIAAVRVGEETLLKRIYIYNNKVVLQAENPKYEPLIYINEELDKINIIGQAVGFTSYF